MGILNLARIGSYSTTTLLATKDGRSGDDYNTLSVRTRALQDVVHPQLDLPIHHGVPLGLDLGIGRHRADGPILGLLLDLLHQGFEGKEVCVASIRALLWVA